MPPWTGTDATYCGTGPTPFTSDYVFCDLAIIHFWQVSLYLAILFWGLLTVANLLPMFHSGAQDQAIAGEVVRQLFLQMGLLILTACSFYLLQVINQGESDVVDALSNVNSGPGSMHNCVDCLWTGPVADMIGQVHSLVQTQGSDDIFQALSGGQFTFAPTDSPTAGLFGQSWGQIIGGVATFASTFTTLGPAVRYVVMLLAVGSAPFAVMAAGHRFTRPLFSLWLHLWGELVVLSLLSALVVAGWNAISGNITNGATDATTSVYIGLAALGLLGGMNLAYIMRMMGNFIQTTSGFYQANYQRLSSSVLTTLKAGAAVAGIAGGVTAALGGVAVAGGTAGAGNLPAGPATGSSPGGSGLLSPFPTGGIGGAGATSAAQGDADGNSASTGAGVFTGTPTGTSLPSAWREWPAPATGGIAASRGGSATPLGVSPAMATALPPGRASNATPLPAIALPPAPTGRWQGVATVVAHSGLPVASNFAGPLAAGLSYAQQTAREQLQEWRYADNQAHRTAREQLQDWRYADNQAHRTAREQLQDDRHAFSLSESARKEQIATERYNQSQEKSDRRYAAGQTSTLWQHQEASRREAERKTESTQRRAEAAAYGLWRQREAALRDAERKAESDQRSANTAAYGLWRQRESSEREARREAEAAQNRANAAAYGLFRQRDAAISNPDKEAEKEEQYKKLT